MTRNSRKIIVDLFGQRIQAADPSKLFPGAVVVIKGLKRGVVMTGLVVMVHPQGALMTDVDGDEIPWTGQMPIIDALIIERDATNPAVGAPALVTKVPWYHDIESRASWKGLPRMITEMAPRYIVIGALHGD